MMLSGRRRAAPPASAATGPGWLLPMLDAAPDAFVVVDAEQVVLEWSRQAVRTFGWSREEAVGQPLADLVVPLELRASQHRRLTRGLAARSAAEGPVTLDATDRGGRRFTVELTALQVDGDGGARSGAFLRDVDVVRAAEEEPEPVATTPPHEDPLTALLNHCAFQEELDRRLTATTGSVALVLFDLEGLAVANHEHGFAEGDRLLVAFAAVLREAAGDGACGRLGGDLFAVALSDATAVEAKALTAEVTRRAAAAHLDLGVCAGVAAAAPEHAAVREQLLLVAELSLQARKTTREGERRYRSAQRRLREGGAAPEVVRSARAPLVHALRAVREHLDVDVAFLAEFAGGEEVFRIKSGDAAAFGLVEGAALPFGEDFCRRVLRGRLGPIVVPGTDPGLAGLPPGATSTVGTFVGVPVRLPDGRLHGALCCLSRRPIEDHDPRDMDLLAVLADVAADHLAELEDRDLEHRTDTEALGVTALLAALGARDPATADHAGSVADLARRVARTLGLDPDEVHAAGQVARLHEIGKLGVADAVLGKPGPLDDAERAAVRRSPTMAAAVVAAVPALGHLANVVGAVHERWDGAGYPAGLAGEAIPRLSRVVAACDAFDAMTSDRPFRAALPAAAARQELAANAGRQFDPEVVTALQAVLDRP